MRSLMLGKSIPQAALDAKVGRTSVDRWLQRIRQGGIDALLRDAHRRSPKWQATGEQAQAVRRAIAAALARPLEPPVKERLVAIDIVLAGRAIEPAAASAHVLPGTVREWLRLVARDGFAATLARWENVPHPRSPQIDADPAAFRELAAKEENRHRRRQMLALALVAEGMTPHAAAFKAGANYGSVLKRIRRFGKEGFDAFRDKPRYGLARKLAPAQLQELRSEMLALPEISYRQLQHFVLARFGVHYTIGGLRLLLKREFRIAAKNGRFMKAATAPPLTSRQRP
jgi:transposase